MKLTTELLYRPTRKKHDDSLRTTSTVLVLLGWFLVNINKAPSEVKLKPENLFYIREPPVDLLSYGTSTVLVGVRRHQ